MNVYTFNPIIMGGTKERKLEVDDATLTFGQTIVRFDDVQDMTSYISETTHSTKYSRQRKFTFTFVFWLLKGEKVKIEFDDLTPKMSTEEGRKIYRYVLDIVWENIGKPRAFTVMKELNEGKTIAIDKKIDLDKNGLTIKKTVLFIKRQKTYAWNELALRRPYGYFIIIENRMSKKIIKRFDGGRKSGIIYREVMFNFMKKA